MACSRAVQCRDDGAGPDQAWDCFGLSPLSFAISPWHGLPACFINMTKISAWCSERNRFLDVNNGPRNYRNPSTCFHSLIAVLLCSGHPAWCRGSEPSVTNLHGNVRHTSSPGNRGLWLVNAQLPRPLVGQHGAWLGWHIGRRREIRVISSSLDTIGQSEALC